jgi:hypothetical protein
MLNLTDPAYGRDAFAITLLEESKRFLEKAKGADDGGGKAFLHSALLLGFCSLEAHVNSIAEDLASTMDLTPHEVGLLREREVRLESGVFRVSNTLRMVRLEDRIRFLCARFPRNPVDFSAAWWSKLGQASDLRNALTHPKDDVPLEFEAVASAIEAIVDTLDAVYVGVLGRPFPIFGLRLDSLLDF